MSYTSMLHDMNVERRARLMRLGVIQEPVKAIETPLAPPQIKAVPTPEPEPLSPSFSVERIICQRPLRLFEEAQFIRTILRAVAAEYGVFVDNLTGPLRWDVLVRPRHVAIYLAKRLTGLGTIRLGQRFKRDHSTIHHAIEKIKEARKIEPELDVRLNRLETMFRKQMETSNGAGEE